MPYQREDPSGQAAADAIRARWVRLLVVAFSLAVALRSWFAVKQLGFLGWDTYPLLEASRLGGGGDLVGLFVEPLLGDPAEGLYYRPLLKLSLAFDHALFGLVPAGYHLTNALLVGATAIALHELARRLLAPGALLGPLFAWAYFLFHPVLATVVPVASRRADLLCLLFTLVTLALVAAATRSGRTRSLLTVVFAACAMASKEAGFLLVGLVPACAWLLDPARDARERIRSALHASLPTASVALVLFGVRFAILGGLVGERPLRTEGLPAAMLAMSVRIAEWVLAPGRIIAQPELPVLALCVFSGAAVATWRFAPPSERTASLRACGPALGLALVWIAGVTLLYSIGIILQPWYIPNPLAAFALFAGALCEGLRRLAGSNLRARASAVVALASTGALLVQLAISSPPVRGDDSWARASAISESYLTELGARIDASPNGTRLRVARVPQQLPRNASEPRLEGVAMLALYSVEAWARLTRPERKLRFVVGGRGPVVAADDELVIVVGGKNAVRER